MKACIIDNIIGQKFMIRFRGNAAYFITAVRHTAMKRAINMGIAPGACFQVQTAISVSTDMGTFRHCCMKTAMMAFIPFFDEPYADKIRLKNFHRSIGYLLDLFVKRRGVQQIFLKVFQQLNPSAGSLQGIKGIFPPCNITGDHHAIIFLHVGDLERSQGDIIKSLPVGWSFIPH